MTSLSTIFDDGGLMCVLGTRAHAAAVALQHRIGPAAIIFAGTMADARQLAKRTRRVVLVADNGSAWDRKASGRADAVVYALRDRMLIAIPGRDVFVIDLPREAA